MKELERWARICQYWGGGYWKRTLWCVSKYVPTDLHIGIWLHLLFHIYPFLFPVNRWSSQGLETGRHWVNLLKTIGQLMVVTTANQLPYFGDGWWGYGEHFFRVRVDHCFPSSTVMMFLVSNPMCTLHYGLEGHVFSTVIPVRCI